MWLQRVGHDWSDLAHKQTTVKNLLFVLCFLGGGGGSGGWQRRKNNIYSRYSLFFLVLEVRKRLSSLIYLFKNLLYSVLGVHFYWLHACMCMLSFQWSWTLCDPMDCSLPGSSIHGNLQARILEWVAMLSSRGSSQPRDWTRIPYIYLHWQAGS